MRLDTGGNKHDPDEEKCKKESEPRLVAVWQNNTG